MDVVIVGGGWAGLAAAVELAGHGTPTLVLESARQLGGRARAVRFGAYHVDNGQHMLLGACHSVLTVLRTLGVSEASVFRRQPLNLSLRGATGEEIRFRTHRLPAPLHLAAGLLLTEGISFNSRIAALRLLRDMRKRGFTINPDIALKDYLAIRKQGPEALRALWQPLCLAALNTPVATASTKLFLRVIRDIFFAGRRDSDLLLPILDLSACLPRPATDYIEQRGGSVRLGVRVSGIAIKDGAVSGVLVQDELIPAKHVIVATPPAACVSLLREHAALANIATRVASLTSQPICTLYLRYPEHITLERDFVGLLDSSVQWLFDRGRLTGDKGLISAVIGGASPYMRLSAEALTDTVAAEIARYFPTWPAPSLTKLIRERQATVAAVTDVDRLRPAHATPVKGLWLAGDYTATGYPSTLEGAVKSGLICARWILRHAASAAPVMLREAG